MRRLNRDYENLKERMAGLLRQARALAASLAAQGLEAPAGRIKLVCRRMENICASCNNLGSTAPGLDEATLKKVEAVWKICRRRAMNVTGTRMLGGQFQALLESMNGCESYLKGLAG